MNRRDLLKLLLASATAQFVDYEKLLWIPGEKNIFIPKKPEIISVAQIVKEAWEETVSSLYGIPYHEYNITSDIWLGVKRKK